MAGRHAAAPDELDSSPPDDHDADVGVVGRWRRWRVDLAAVAICFALVPVVHNIGAALRPPYWLDEAWVAASAKGSLTQLPWLTAVTPIGWTALVWLFPPTAQLQRLVPLAFLAGSVGAGYAFARLLGWSTRGRAVLAGGLTAASVLLLPAQQVRHDLKQYTADACLSLLLLALLAWTESAWSRRRAATLGGAIVVGMLVSHAVALVGAAALGGLLIVAALTRNWRRLLLLLPVGALTGLGMLSVYLVFDRSVDQASLSSYWAGYFPSVRKLPGYITHQLNGLQPVLGMPPWLLLLLAGIGVVTVARLARPATAVALALLPIGAVAAGVLGVYPLLDERTSHFLLVTAAAAAGGGLFGMADLASRLLRTDDRTKVIVAAGVALVAVAAFAVVNDGWWRYPGRQNGNGEDIRSEVAYVAAHRLPGDVILVNMSGNYGFAYYWSADPPVYARGGVQATEWYVTYPPSTRIVIAAGRDRTSVIQSLQRAEALAGPTGRIWLIRSHVIPAEAASWEVGLAGHQVQTFPVGVEPVALLLSQPDQPA